MERHNKVDKKDQRSEEVINEISDLFLEYAEHDHQLEFTVLYAIGREGIVGKEISQNANHSLTITDSKNLQPLFQTIIHDVPSPVGTPEGGFQMQVVSLDADSHKGTYIIGKVYRGSLKIGDPLVIVREGVVVGKGTAEYICTYWGLKRELIEQTTIGDIVAIAGLTGIKLGDTITTPDAPQGLPHLPIAEPTIQIEMSVSNSPFVGRDGTFVTSRQIGERLRKELETNVGLRMGDGSTSESFTLSGRGELHLTILIETMRREGYEFSVSQPRVIYKEVNGAVCEPWEELTIETSADYSGAVITALGLRKATMLSMKDIRNGVQLVYRISTRNIIGLRSELLKKTSGMLLFASRFIGYESKGMENATIRNGVIVSSENGQALSYSLEKVQQRATTFVGPGEDVYRGMIVGQNSRQEDLVMNVCKGKKLTNMRAASGDDIIKLAPPVKLSLEQCLVFLNEDELLEVTPKHLRLRKRDLNVKH